MRMMMFMFMCFSSLLVLAQDAPPEPVTSAGDKDLANLIAKVESGEKPSEANYNSAFKAEEGNAVHEEVAAFSKRYFNSLLTDDLVSTYQMMSSDYRKAVNLQSYLKKDHYKILEVNVADFQFIGEGCARIMGKTRCIAGRLGTLDLPLKLRIFKEGDKWVVFSNPYEQMGFTLPNAAKIKYPCEF